MEDNRRLSHFLRDTVGYRELISSFTDIRKHPVIPLQNIISTILFMPFFHLTSLLSLDRLNRKGAMKRLFASKRKMIVSDTTVHRVLSWLSLSEAHQLLLNLKDLIHTKRLSRLHLSTNGTARRIGIIDGSQMGKHWIAAACLVGKVRYPFWAQPYEKYGKELPAAYSILHDSYQALTPALYPDLWCLDALYFNKRSFDLVRGYDSHLLVKSQEPFRDVLRDAHALFSSSGNAVDTSLVSEGFDSDRWCSYWIEQTSGEFAGYPIQILHISEYYPKRKRNAHSECWVVTTDLTLTPEEVREAAHLRWQIENNVFKRLSYLSGTKRFTFKDNKPFLTMLLLFFSAITMFDAYIYMLQQNKAVFKQVLGGMKFTWTNLFSQLEEQMENRFFCILFGSE